MVERRYQFRFAVTPCGLDLNLSLSEIVVLIRTVQVGKTCSFAW